MNFFRTIIIKNLSLLISYPTHKILKILFLKNTSFFYSRYLNSDALIVLILKNIANPKRFFTKLKYGTVKFLPNSLLSGSESPRNPSLEDKAENYVKKLKRDGFLILNSAHPEIADYILKKHKYFSSSQEKKIDEYKNLILDIYDEKISELIVNPLYLSIMSGYYNHRQPFLRTAPVIKITSPLSKRVPTSEALENRSNINCDWHFDTVNMLQIHLLLDDVTEKDTHMLLASGSHLSHRVNLTPRDYCYSDEYVSKKYEIVPVIGKKGTLIIWDSNAIHCANPIPGTTRLHLQTLFTPGNDMLVDLNGANACIKFNWGELSKLNPLSKNAFKFVKYDKKNNYIKVAINTKQNFKFQSIEER